MSLELWLRMDVLTQSQRSRCMAAIRSKNTRPELFVRRLVFSMGHRYRLHAEKLPGRPDLIFSQLRKVIFVHGCFWHMHCCRFGRVIPKTNASFWAEKRGKTVKRDRLVKAKLAESGWDVCEVWECEIKDTARLKRKLGKFLSKPNLL